MLEITETIETIEPQIEVGDDLPLKIGFGMEIENIDNIFTWRCTNIHQLIEVRVNSDNGRLLEINFILIPYEKLENKKIINEIEGKNHKEYMIGLPMINLNYWYQGLVSRDIGIDTLDRTIDEDLDFFIEVDKSNLLVKFSSEIPSGNMIECGKVLFYLTRDNKLCGIAVRGINVKKLLKIIK